MHKRHIHYFWRRLQPFNAWYFFLLCVVFAVIGLFAARQNNLNAISLRDNVVKIDERNGDVEGALRELRTYIYSHMNTNLAPSAGSIKPPVQLKYRYERLVKAEKDRVSAENEKIYTNAQAECERLIPTGKIAGRVPCVQEYVAQHGIAEQPVPDALYKFDFQSPAWSPDLAGWSFVVAGVLFILFIVRSLLQLWFKYVLNQHA